MRPVLHYRVVLPIFDERSILTPTHPNFFQIRPAAEQPVGERPFLPGIGEILHRQRGYHDVLTNTRYGLDISKLVKFGDNSFSATNVIKSHVAQRHLYSYIDKYTLFFELLGRWENRQKSSKIPFHRVMTAILSTPLVIDDAKTSLRRAGKLIAAEYGRRTNTAESLQSGAQLRAAKPLLILRGSFEDLVIDKKLILGARVNLRGIGVYRISETDADVYLINNNAPTSRVELVESLITRLHLDQQGLFSLLALDASARLKEEEKRVWRKAVMDRAKFLSHKSEERRQLEDYRKVHDFFANIHAAETELAQDVYQHVDAQLKQILQNIRIEAINMGDNFSNISDSTINNKNVIDSNINSALASGKNSSAMAGATETAIAAVKEIAASDSSAPHLEDLGELKAELEKNGASRKALGIWERIKTGIPLAAHLAKVADTIDNIFGINGVG